MKSIWLESKYLKYLLDFFLVLYFKMSSERYLLSSSGGHFCAQNFIISQVLISYLKLLY